MFIFLAECEAVHTRFHAQSLTMALMSKIKCGKGVGDAVRSERRSLPTLLVEKQFGNLPKHRRRLPRHRSAAGAVAVTMGICAEAAAEQSRKVPAQTSAWQGFQRVTNCPRDGRRRQPLPIALPKVVSANNYGLDSRVTLC
jgi:hypothetical protein